MAIDYNMTVLIVDDFATMRKIVKNIMTQLGFKNFIEADDGSVAWDLLQKEDVDFIVSDWNMPKMTGIELLKKVRSEYKKPDIPFLMVTAEAQKENIVEAVKAKVSNYIVNPFTPETLSEKIEKIFE
jgi:two-component system chemotaxis response regulator CheY